jgi:hypothetical protein
VDTPVTIVASEDGKIHCLDAVGNGDGTTSVYWTYPSHPGAADDPNLQGSAGPDGELGVLRAQMPNGGFDLSTAVVQRITNGSRVEDLLYIAGRNGRVYCIEMAGRGDFDRAAGVPGTTERRWSYPATIHP